MLDATSTLATAYKWAGRRLRGRRQHPTRLVLSLSKDGTLLCSGAIPARTDTRLLRASG
jgi:uncharacterized protein YciI